MAQNIDFPKLIPEVKNVMKGLSLKLFNSFSFIASQRKTSLD